MTGKFRMTSKFRMTGGLFQVVFGVYDAGIAGHGAMVCRLAFLDLLDYALVNSITFL